MKIIKYVKTAHNTVIMKYKNTTTTGKTVLD